MSASVGSERTLQRSHGNGFCWILALRMHDSVTGDAGPATVLTAAGFVVAGYAGATRRVREKSGCGAS